LVVLPGVSGAAVYELRFDGEEEGERPIRARWEGVSGMSEIWSLAREGRRGRRPRERFRRK
jgi:hypothetical protein